MHVNFHISSLLQIKCLLGGNAADGSFELSYLLLVKYIL